MYVTWIGLDCMVGPEHWTHVGYVSHYH